MWAEKKRYTNELGNRSHRSDQSGAVSLINEGASHYDEKKIWKAEKSAENVKPRPIIIGHHQIP